VAFRAEGFPIILRSYSNPMSPEPNKSPEPTRGAVTPRAKESASEIKRQNPSRPEARGAPAPRVAHL